jgi:hypothetical protein
VPFKDGDLVTQHENLRVFLAVAHRQQPHSRERVGDSQESEAKQHE